MIERIDDLFDRELCKDFKQVFAVERKRTTVEQEAIETLIKRQDKGMLEYGQGIEMAQGYDWLPEIIEELTDGLQYAVAMKQRRDAVVVELCNLYRDLSILEVALFTGNDEVTADDVGDIASRLSDVINTLKGK